ncbi:hypothetical protein NSTC745_06434 [Nostoc sp. DSM 114161]|jgi:hypothetical protein|uniref:hypothetical protein n=1 Tax=Nostoc sp. DSM 114161 TaxID=3440143 RepID=UPI0040460E6F
MNEISNKLRDYRINALANFVGELIPLMEAEGFSFGDFAMAQSLWAENQPEWQDSAFYLEQAANPPKHPLGQPPKVE